MSDLRSRNGLIVRVSKKISLPQIITDRNRFYVSGREVTVSSPSEPIPYSIKLEPDISAELEDKFPPEYALTTIVARCLNGHENYIKRNRGFVIWSSFRNQISEHLPNNGDYMQLADIHGAVVQFFKYGIKS